jgi:hypothetical protein
VHYVLSENVIYVMVGGFVPKKYNGHDMLKLKTMRLESSNSWKPLESGLVGT